MSSITIDTELDDKVAELSEKAQRIERSKDTESKVVDAATDINRINDRLDDVCEQAEELRFYMRLYEKTFDETRPGGVQPQIRSAVEKININDEELLRAAQDGRLAHLEDQVEKAESQVETATKRIRDAIEAEQTSWQDDLERARELNEIVGSDSDFQSLIRQMRSFLGSEMWNTGKDPSQLQAQWQRYERKWKENAGKHGWETFQDEHNLDESTVEELKQFSDDESVRLSDLSLHTLEEIKRVPDLEQALQIEVRS